MNNTPETDAEVILKQQIRCSKDAECSRFVRYCFACKLELEREDWQKCAEHLADALKFWIGDERYQIGGHHESQVALDRFHKLKEGAK